MSSDDLASAQTVRLHAQDTRRVPLIGVAVGLAVAATVLMIMESGLLVTWLVVALWLAVVGLVLAILPPANSLTLAPDGFRIRVFGLFGGFVPWSEVASVEAGEGWAGGGVVVRLTDAAAGRRIVGLPEDATLGLRSLIDHYGRDAEELAGAMECRRLAATRR